MNNQDVMINGTAKNAVGTYQPKIEDQEYLASDVLIPRLLLMQGLSPLVTSRKAQLGDIVRSTTQEKLGNPEKPVDIVPIKLVPVWFNFQEMGGKFQYRGMEARHSKNERLEWEYEMDGSNWQRKKAYMLYALVPQDVVSYEVEIKKALDKGEAPDLNRTVLPVVITFQSTSFKHAGKKLASFFNNVVVNSKRVKGLTPYQYVLTLTCREEKNAKGTYYIWDALPPKALTDKSVRDEAQQWAKILGTQSVKIDESELDTEGGSDSESIDV